MINLSYSTRLLPTTHSSITILTGSLKTKQTQNNVRKKVFLLHIPHKTTFEVTAHFKSSVSPQRTDLCRTWPYFFLHKYKARNSKRHSQHYSSFWWTTTSYPGSTPQVERAAAPTGFLFRQSASHNTQSKRETTRGNTRKRYEKNWNTRGKGKSSMAIEKG